MKPKLSNCSSVCIYVFLHVLLLSAFVVFSQDSSSASEPKIVAESDAEQNDPPKIEADPGSVYVSPQVISSDVCYLAENFDSGNINVFKSRWVRSESKKENVDEEIAKYDGEWNIEAAVENALNGDLGLVLKSKAKHHAVSARLDRPFRFSNKSPLIIQYDVRFQEGMECGGAYIKLISESDFFQLSDFHDKTPYTIMFGPDKCGNDLKLHFIFKFTNPKSAVTEEKHLVWDNSDSFKHIFSDRFSHLLTLALEPDSTFELSLDQVVIKKGSLLNDFKPPVIPPAEIDDPSDVKPQDWDERAKIPDPEAVKPEDWDENEPEKIADPSAVKPEAWLDDEPLYIPDPRAEKPGDWDVDLDGEWEAPLIENPRCKPGCGIWKAPMIENPKFKGKWHAPLIENPNYKGIWSPKKMANPDYFEESNPFEKLSAISAIGLELWSMSNNIIFDNFVITSDSEVAAQYAKETWVKKKAKERSGYANSDSVVDFLYKSADQNPWLWIVYALAVILPVTCCASYILSKPKPKRKKTASNAASAASNKTSVISSSDTTTTTTANVAAEEKTEDGSEEQEQDQQVEQDDQENDPEEEAEEEMDDEESRATEENENETSDGDGDGENHQVDEGESNEEQPAEERSSVVPPETTATQPRKRRSRKD